MNLRKRIASLAICGTLFIGSINFAFADGARVVTLGANLNEQQELLFLNTLGLTKMKL